MVNNSNLSSPSLPSGKYFLSQFSHFFTNSIFNFFFTKILANNYIEHKYAFFNDLFIWRVLSKFKWIQYSVYMASATNWIFFNTGCWLRCWWSFILRDLWWSFFRITLWNLYMWRVSTKLISYAHKLVESIWQFNINC